MPAPGSISGWISPLQAGDPTAAQKLWETYFHRLVALARQRLRALPRRAVDEEDVALSAFDSFCRGAALGRFPRLDDRDDLWQVLLVLTQRKAADVLEHEGRSKRDWRRLAPAGVGEPPPLAGLAAAEPDPAFAAQLADDCRHLLERLGDDELRAIAVHKMEGHSNEEVAALLGCSLATVERRLRLIRKEWQSAATD
jgi:DNA-directed RNA polymerase specialized sigma24 family protein